MNTECGAFNPVAIELSHIAGTGQGSSYCETDAGRAMTTTGGMRLLNAFREIQERKALFQAVSESVNCGGRR
jgi:hypothetical protein